MGPTGDEWIQGSRRLLIGETEKYLCSHACESDGTGRSLLVTSAGGTRSCAAVDTWQQIRGVLDSGLFLVEHLCRAARAKAAPGD